MNLPSGVDVVCGVVASREDAGPDWLDSYIPLGALARADRRVGGYPFDAPGTSSLEWRRPIDNWLAQIGGAVYSAVAYRLAAPTGSIGL